LIVSSAFVAVEWILKICGCRVDFENLWYKFYGAFYEETNFQRGWLTHFVWFGVLKEMRAAL
jgi:hypothetical protein